MGRRIRLPIMVTIKCDNCSATKSQDRRSAPWILGYDIETESPSAVSHSVRFLDRWDDARILELGAIHLCSLECREKYLKKARAA